MKQLKSISMFIALLKKPGVDECDLHRKNQPNVSYNETYLPNSEERSAQLNQTKNRTKRRRVRKKKTGTRNSIFILRMLSKRRIQTQ